MYKGKLESDRRMIGLLLAVVLIIASMSGCATFNSGNKKIQVISRITYYETDEEGVTTTYYDDYQSTYDESNRCLVTKAISQTGTFFNKQT